MFSTQINTQVRTAAVWLTCAALAATASASKNLVSSLTDDVQTSDGASHLDPGSMGSANNPGKISQGPGDGPGDGGGDDHKRDGKTDIPLILTTEREIGADRNFTKDFGTIDPPFVDHSFTMSGEMNFIGTTDRSAGTGQVATGWAPVPAPGTLIVLGAAAGLGSRRRRA